VLLLQTQAVIAAMSWESPVEHPLVDRIRACSSTPNDAADFFTHLLHPIAELRLTTVEALHHPYMISCFKHMQCDRQAPSCPPVNLDEEARAAQRRSVLRAVGNLMRVPHAVSLVKKAAGIVARPVSKPFNCIRHPVHGDSVPDLSVYFPRYTHHSQDSQVMASVALVDSMKSGIRVYGGSRVTAEGVVQHLVLCYPMPSPASSQLQTGHPVHEALPQLCPPESQADAQPAASATSGVVIEEVESAESEPPAASSRQKLDSHPIDTSDEEEDWEDSEAASSITSATSSDATFVSAATHFVRVTASDVTAALPSTTAAISDATAADVFVSAHGSSGTTTASRCGLLAVVLI